jgi:hypothetical protein
MNQQPGISFSPGAAGGAPTPAPIHDIVGPIPFFSGPLWIIAAAILVVAVLGGLLWWFLGRRKIKSLTPQETALAALARLREKVSEGDDHDFGVGVSDVLRRFLGEALGLAAPRQTTEEFLSSLQGSLRFVPAEQEALSQFLCHADYLKYARGEATTEQRLALIEAAESFVRSRKDEDVTQPTGKRSGGSKGSGPLRRKGRKASLKTETI